MIIVILSLLSQFMIFAALSVIFVCGKIPVSTEHPNIIGNSLRMMVETFMISPRRVTLVVSWCAISSILFWTALNSASLWGIAFGPEESAAPLRDMLKADVVIVLMSTAFIMLLRRSQNLENESPLKDAYSKAYYRTYRQIDMQARLLN